MPADATSTPPEVRDKVIRRVYAEAVEMDWQSLPAPRKSAQYDRWVADKDVGGVLARFMPEDRIRVWLKDGPLKEYGNATHGMGPYAELAPRLGPTPAQAVKAAFGDGWNPVAGTERIKPLGVDARGPDDEHGVVVYGPARKFPALVWAALVAAVDRDLPPDRAVVLVTERPAEPTPTINRRWQSRIADHCRVGLRHANFDDGR